MADTKISALSQVGQVAGGNEFAVNFAGTSQKATATQIRQYFEGSMDQSPVTQILAAGYTLATDHSMVVNRTFKINSGVTCLVALGSRLRVL